MLIASPRAAPRRGPGWIPGARHTWPWPAPSSSPGHLWIRGQLTPHNPRRLSPYVDRPVDNYTLVFPHLCPQMWMNHSAVLSGLSFMAAGLRGASQGRCVSCAVSSLLRHPLGQEPWAGRWSWKRGQDEGKRSGGASVSTALTLTPNRDCSPRKNRSIPTISVG